MQLLVAEIYELPDCGNGTLLNCSSCLDDLLYSGQIYCSTFPITAALFRYKVGFFICCLTFLWQQKCWSEIIALPILTEPAL